MAEFFNYILPSGDISDARAPRRRVRRPSRFGASLLAILSAIAVPVSLTPLSAQEQDEEQTVLFEADEVNRGAADAPIIAEGNVKAYFGERFLVSDRVTYDPTTDIVVASGNVAITDTDGQTYFADEVELTGNLKDGIATNFSALLADDARLAGSTVVKRGDSSNELTNAVYTACEVCEEDGTGKTPSWQVRAGKVTQDKEEKIIRFENAVFEALGFPLFYTPYFQIPDPEVKRQSGLLPPAIGNSTRLGTYLELPYYIALSDHQDVTLSPKLMSDQGVLFKGEYRLMTEEGSYVFQPGIIAAKDDNLVIPLSNGNENIIPLPDLRYHIFAEGMQKLTDLWTARFDIDYVSDKEYLRSYDIEPEGDLQEPAGLYRPDRLSSSIALARRTQNSLLTVESLGFQSLRRSDDNDYSAQALPRVQYEASFDDPFLGGKFGIESSLLYLTRVDGANTLRGILSADWERLFTTRSGHRFSLFGQLRGDAYQYSGLSGGAESCFLPDEPTLSQQATFATCQALLPGGGEENDLNSSRFLPTAGISWSYPLAKQTENATIIIEPHLQLVTSPELDEPENILNEDSQFFELDTTTLFDWNKSSGFDLWEDGTRLNAGITGAMLFNNGLTVEAGIGQQFRQEETSVYEAFNLESGLGDTQSDIVGSLDVNWGRNLSFENELRFDKDDGTVRRAESSFTGRYGRFTTGLDYIKIQRGSTGNFADRDEYRFSSLAYDINENWRVGARIREDLVGLETVDGEVVSNPGITRQTLQLTYTDECTKVYLSYSEDKTALQGFDFDRSLTLNVELRGFSR